VKRVAIKWTYLLALIGFGVWVFDVFFGGHIYLRGDGLVLGQPAVVAAEYNVTVREVMVKGRRASCRRTSGCTDIFAASDGDSRQTELRSSFAGSATRRNGHP
jgi:hypothetical protein